MIFLDFLLMPNLFGVQVSIIMASRGGHDFLATRGGHKSHIFRVPELRYWASVTRTRASVTRTQASVTRTRASVTRSQIRLRVAELRLRVAEFGYA